MLYLFLPFVSLIHWLPLCLTADWEVQCWEYKDGKAASWVHSFLLHTPALTLSNGIEWEPPLNLSFDNPVVDIREVGRLSRGLTDNWEQGPSYDQQPALAALWGFGISTQIWDIPGDTVWDRLALVLLPSNGDLKDGTYRWLNLHSSGLSSLGATLFHLLTVGENQLQLCMWTHKVIVPSLPHKAKEAEWYECLEELLMTLWILYVKHSSSLELLTIFRKMISQVSKAMSRGSHSTSTDVSLIDLNFSPSGAGKSVRNSTTGM